MSVSVKGYRGIAFNVRGPEVAYDEEGEEYETGRLVVVMVGDDRRHVVDADDVSPLDADRFCSDCGQIGCSWSNQ